MPYISLGLPVFNGEQYLEAALDSILAQTYTDFELIVSDNGSADLTESICRRYAAADSRIRYERHETNRGAAWNYNNVLQAAAGLYFKWTTHDNLLAPTFLEECVRALEGAPPSVVVCFTKTRVINEHGEVSHDQEGTLDTRGMKTHERVIYLLRNNIWSDPVFGLMRRSLLASTRMHGTYPSADYVLVTELALRGEFLEIPQYLNLRREHPLTSRRANTSVEEVAMWFDPANHGKEAYEALRLFREHLAAVRLAPISSAEKLVTGTRLAVALVRGYEPYLHQESIRWLSRRLRGGSGRPVG